MTKANRPNRPPTHPGAIWREDILPALGLTVAGAARDLAHATGRKFARSKAELTPLCQPAGMTFTMAP